VSSFIVRCTPGSKFFVNHSLPWSYSDGFIYRELWAIQLSDRTVGAVLAHSVVMVWSIWESQTEAGRSGLTLKAIVAAAIDIADTNGVDALSMRKVAERLGVGTMSLYTHVPGKADLIDLMFDTVYGELYASVESPSQQPGGWRGALHFIAQQNWDLYHRHPWMLQAATGRSILGPHAALKCEAELRPLDQLGLSDVEMDAVLTLILTHVEGAARSGHAGSHSTGHKNDR
jgi:AcrR family transcriptional regulator